ncbi:zinc finger protein 853 [Thalassophryne amazonica]|uniref:zinc finger protein 853 n=1 Tax=Thalassophryne amazonica TaxID=390379 RepID=UPI00147185B7|nr:zinc finger protein 853 [Thalassophryne amazonica]
MMPKKQSPWHDTQVNNKTNKPMLNKKGKLLSVNTSRTPGGGQSGSSVDKVRLSSSRSSNSVTAGSKLGISLKRSSNHQWPKQVPQLSKPAVHLSSSSQSVSSLNTSSLSAATFLTSSGSLGRLDQSFSDNETKKGKSSEKTVVHDHLSSQELLSSLPKQRTHLKSQNSDAQSAEKVTLPSSCLHERCRVGAHETSEWAEEQQQTEPEPKLQPKKEKSSSSSSPVTSSQESITSSPSTDCTKFPSGPHQVEEGGGASCYQLPLHVGTTQIDLADASSQDGDESSRCSSTTVPSNAEYSDKSSNKLDESQQPWQQSENTLMTEDQQLSKNVTCPSILETDKLGCEQQTGRLVKENDDSLCGSSLEQGVALQRVQKMNHELCFELEALKSRLDEAREAELRWRLDLLAQQAQLLVTGDANALAQARLEQNQRYFQEQQVEWERCVASLKSQLSISEEQRKEAESRLSQQQEMQDYKCLQQEADSLRKKLQEVTSKLCANEEAQAQKEAHLQKHLVLLQELQERLDRAEQQVENRNKSQSWAQGIKEAQQQHHEELVRTVSALQKLQEEREQLNCRCQELQNQLSEADVQVSRMQNRLEAEETSYYNLGHSYERVCEELQVALEKVQQRESETQDVREDYERLLDMKEQELREVLLKMEILGNSLEETECNCRK